MLDLAWSEILLIIVVALVVIGPKDLPGAIRGIADGIKKAKRQFAQFQQQADELVREAKLDEVRNQIAEVKSAISEIRNFDLKGEIRKAVDEDGSIARAFEDPFASPPPAAPAWTPPPTARDCPDAPAMIPPQTMAPYRPPEPPPPPPPVAAPAFVPPATPAPVGLAAAPPLPDAPEAPAAPPAAGASAAAPLAAAEPGTASAAAKTA